MVSFGTLSRSALTTVNPPTPESKTPIGRGLLMLRESPRNAQTLQAHITQPSRLSRQTGILACGVLGKLEACQTNQARMPELRLQTRATFG